jgi:hypothetical protein
MTSPVWAVALRVVDVLEELGVRYHIGGSFASSIHGLPRQTRDLDLVADLGLSAVPTLVAHLEEEFYLDGELMRRAIERHGNFNLIHLSSGFKIDIFLPGPGAFDRSELARGAPYRLSEDPPRTVVVKSPEDTILRKLAWYRLGGETSDRQWGDVLGIVRTQAGRLDLTYLRRWADTLGVADLLESALGPPT